MSRNRGRQQRGGRQYQRTDRVSGLVREVVATEIERIDDPRLFLISVTGVDVDRELAHAVVWVHGGPEDDMEDVLEALEQYRQRVQQALAKNSRMRRTPTIQFSVDKSIQEAGRIESILEELGRASSEEQSKDG